MIGEPRNKIVNFAAYCLKCVHWSKYEYEDPCHECLNNPANTDSHKPVHYTKNPSYKEDSRKKQTL